MKTFCMTAVAMLAMGFAGAEEVPTDATSPNNQTQQEGAPLGTQVQTAGKIVSVHSCPMVGMADAHMIVKIQTEQGDTDIVDLGPTAELKSNGMEPKEGQKLWVDGRVGQINDKFLIVADQLSETKMITVARNAPLTQETVKHAEKRTGAEAPVAVGTPEPGAAKVVTVDTDTQIRTVEGTVIHSRRVKIVGEAEEHVFAKIQTANGIAVIDLGTCSAMPTAVNINDGQTLAASGYVGQMNGKPIIYADTVGNQSVIQRPIPTNAAPVK